MTPSMSPLLWFLTFITMFAINENKDFTTIKGHCHIHSIGPLLGGHFPNGVDIVADLRQWTTFVGLEEMPFQKGRRKELATWWWWSTGTIIVTKRRVKEVRWCWRHRIIKQWQAQKCDCHDNQCIIHSISNADDCLAIMMWITWLLYDVIKENYLLLDSV